MPAARRLVREVLAAWGLEELVDPAELLVTELATNAVRHAASPFQVVLARQAGDLLVQVADRSPRGPRESPSRPDLLAEGGRGMFLLDAMATHWGWRPTAEGKVLWFTLAVLTRAA